MFAGKAERLARSENLIIPEFSGVGSIGVDYIAALDEIAFMIARSAFGG